MWSSSAEEMNEMKETQLSVCDDYEPEADDLIRPEEGDG